jgi:hypothetical protein
MKKHTQIQSFFWRLANYNSFYMKFCSTSFNNVSGIGLIFFMQLTIAFFSGYLTSLIFNYIWIISFMIGLISVLFLFFYIKYATLFLLNKPSKDRLLILFFCSILISLFLTLPFLLKIFQSQIEYVFLINDGTLNLTNTNKIWKLPFGLYNVWLNQENGILVLFVSSCLFILMLFIFFYPYSLMYQNKTSLYYKIIKLYEERFIQE